MSLIEQYPCNGCVVHVAWPCRVVAECPVCCGFSRLTRKYGRTITFKVQDARCIQRLCPPHSRAWLSRRPASKITHRSTVNRQHYTLSKYHMSIHHSNTIYTLHFPIHYIKPSLYRSLSMFIERFFIFEVSFS